MKQEKTRAAGRIPAKETAVFCTQASLLLKAGVPLGEGLKTLTDEGTPQGKDLLRRIAEKVEETGSLYEGVREAEAFPSYMVQMIRHRRAGGQAGRGSGGPEPLLRAGG